MTVVSGAGLGARESGFRQAAALAFRGGKASDKLSEAHFHWTRRIARAGSMDTDGRRARQKVAEIAWLLSKFRSCTGI